MLIANKAYLPQFQQKKTRTGSCELENERSSLSMMKVIFILMSLKNGNLSWEMP
jgi:hypothetical protein